MDAEGWLRSVKKKLEIA
jgi:hypothetical protein